MFFFALGLGMLLSARVQPVVKCAHSALPFSGTSPWTSNTSLSPVCTPCQLWLSLPMVSRQIMAAQTHSQGPRREDFGEHEARLANPLVSISPKTKNRVLLTFTPWVVLPQSRSPFKHCNIWLKCSRQKFDFKPGQFELIWGLQSAYSPLLDPQSQWGTLKAVLYRSNISQAAHPHEINRKQPVIVLCDRRLCWSENKHFKRRSLTLKNSHLRNRGLHVFHSVQLL